MQIENPSSLVDMEPLLYRRFVYGAVDAGFDHYTIMIGSGAKESFLGLDLHFRSDENDSKIKWKWNWRVTEVPFDKRLCLCYDSSPAIVSNSKKRMMWLDYYMRSKLYVLYYVCKRYYVIDLVHLGALPSRRRSDDYYATLVDLKSDEDDHFGLIWQDKNVYIPTTDNYTYEVISDTEEGIRALSFGGRKLTGHNLTKFKVLDDNQADDDIVLLESRQLCIAPSVGVTVVGVFTMDLAMGLSLSNLFSRLVNRKGHIRILIAGLCTAGKATILRKLAPEIETSSYRQSTYLLSQMCPECTRYFELCISNNLLFCNVLSKVKQYYMFTWVFVLQDPSCLLLTTRTSASLLRMV
ncbi:hypothetical protein DM860_011256 [Cuscuta australis]|uniref:Uncharacterized protein n=1 Tax=Cuscuta australis TaxID=267555 RepID=A0A328DSA1_9ASTE|nr:hypothetical protein DM860_011256 [Cuscuta australis]